MLIAIVGRYNDIIAGSVRGNGKTMSAVYLAHQDFLAGRKIYTNFYTTFSETYKINDLIELFENNELQDATVIIDEAQKYLNNSGVKVATRKRIVGSFIAQTRKRNIDVILTTQRFSQLHKELREQTDIVLLSCKYHYDKKTQKIGELCLKDNCQKDHAIKIYSINAMPPGFVKIDGKSIILNPITIGQYYDSNEIVLDDYVTKKPVKKPAKNSA